MGEQGGGADPGRRIVVPKPASSRPPKADQPLKPITKQVALARPRRKVLEPSGTHRREYPVLANFGRFGLLGQLAEGGMAHLYLARESAEHGGSRNVVIKVLKGDVAEDSETGQMFLEEGRIVMQLSHPNICSMHEYGREAGRFFMAMEHVDGQTLLHTVLRAGERDTRLPLPELVKIFALVAEALDFAHHAEGSDGTPLNVVHRDISLSNIMVRYDGVVKLLDFGVAKADGRTVETEHGKRKGKLSYFSPEQVLGEPLDLRTDIFSLGICLFEALATRRLFKAAKAYDTLEAVLSKDIPKVSRLRKDVPPALDRIVAKMLTRDREHRYQTAEEVQHDLERVLTAAGEMVSSRRIGDLMVELFPEERAAGPELDPEVIVERYPDLLVGAKAEASADEPDEAAPVPLAEPAASAASSPPRALLVGGIAAIGLTLGIGLAVALLSGGDDEASPPDTVAAQEIEPGPEAPEPPTPEPVAEEPLAEEPAAEEPPAPVELTAEQQAELDRLRDRARNHFRHSRFTRAALDYEAATRIDPAHAGSYAGLGAARRGLGEHAAAAEAYRRAIAISPDVAGFHAALGVSLREAGDRDGAIAAFEQAQRIDSGNRTAFDGLRELRSE